MVTKAGVAAPASRVIQLSKVEVLPANHLKSPCIMVDSDGYMAETRFLGARLIGEAAQAQGHTSHPSHLMIVDAVGNPGDVLAVPTMADSEDHISLTWLKKGLQAKLHLAKLLVLKQIQIPEGTRMVIELFKETDPEFGPCVRMKLQGAAFLPKQKARPRKKAAAKA